jgi:hypothetical protein
VLAIHLLQRWELTCCHGWLGKSRPGSSVMLSSAETCDSSRDALFQPVFVMQTAQDVLRSDFTVTWQSVPLHF